MPPKHDAGTATRHYRAFWQRRCRAAAAGAVLEPLGGNCAVLPKDSEPPCRGTALHPAGRFCVDLSDKSVKSYLVRGGILGYAGSRERDENSKGACCNEI